MALNNMGLGFVFTARDLASRSFDRVTTKFNRLDTTTEAGAARMTANLTKLKRGFAGFAVGAGAILGAFSIAKKAGEFEQELARVGAISRATAADMRLLEESASAAGLATQFSPKEAAEGLGVLAAQGFNAAEATNALVPALDLAAGGSIGVADASQAMSSALKVFGLEAKDAGIAADKLLRISNATALQARDLSLALGTVGRGASATKQSIDEMLPAMGLVKNTGVDASVAASSVSSALLMMAKNAKKFSALGVSVTDASGRFRPFLDVVIDTQKALAGYSNDAQRTAKVTELFGRFGVTAFSAISTQVAKGIKDSRGNILQGAAAVEMLRDSMRNAGGAAKEFRDRLLNNFAGQKQLLGGVFDTLVIEAGKPFAEVLKPVVQGIAAILTGLIKIIKLIPAPIKRFVAGFLLAGAALIMVAGAVVAVKAALALLIPMAGAALAALLPVALIALKVVAVVGLVAGAVIGLGKILGISWEDVARSFRRLIDRVRLLWQGLKQLFGDGGFSGAVMKEMNRAENSGLKRFVITLFRIGSRIREFFRGIVGGFKEVVGPGLRALSEAGRELRLELLEIGDQIGGAVGAGANAIADFLPKGASFNKAGAGIGVVIGGLVRIFLEFLRVIVKVFSFFAAGVRHTVGYLKEFAAQARLVAGKIADAFRWMGDKVAGAFRAIRSAAKAIVDPVVKVFRRMADGIRSALEGLQDAMIKVLRNIPDWALPERFEKIKAMALTSDERRQREEADRDFRALPAAVQERNRARMSSANGIGEMIEAVRLLAMDVQANKEAMAAQRAEVHLDGEKVGELIRRADARSATRQFVGVTP